MIDRITADLPVLLVRLATVTFFSMGFIQFFHRLWRRTFRTENLSQSAMWLRRTELMLLTVGLGVFTHLDAMWFVHSDSAIIYHNWALFMVIMPLLFDGFNRFETAMHFGGLILIWYMHHEPVFWQPDNFAAFTAFLAALILFKVYHEKVITNWWVSIVGSFIIASLFWMTMPTHSMGMYITAEYGIQAVILYVCMIGFVLGNWIRQYREDEHNRQLERLADYEQGSYDNSYTNHQHELQTLFATTKAAGRTFTFATLDLDHFRQVNERFGHLAGNAILIEMTTLVEATLRDAKRPYNLFMTTGEEYNIVFPDLAVDEALPIIQACWQAVRKHQFSYESRYIDVTMSAGMTGLQPTDKSINDLYKRADDSLSKSKRCGRDAVVVDGKIVTTADRIEKQLSEYAYFAQGIHELEADDSPKVGHELLLRSYDTSIQRWVLPDTFEIPAWMQITLLKTFMVNSGADTFNLNLTADQFLDLDTATAIAQFVESPEGPSNLTVEITSLSDSQTTRRISARYRAAGIKIMVDDVGSDNSFELVQPSLPYINGVKFAMQNLRKTTSQEELRARIKFWCDVARDYDLDFVLEGIETEADWQMASELGIKKGQGYLFSKPNPATMLKVK